MKKRCFTALMAILAFLFVHAAAEIQITEVVSRNVTLRLDENGRAHDYAVIANTGNEPVSIGGYRLSDGGPDEYLFEDILLAPGESVTVYCTGEKGGAPFKIAAEGETLYLYDGNGTLCQTLAVPAMTYNQRFCNGSILEGGGIPAPDSPYISEILAVNTLLPVDGDKPDFVELYNPGDEAVNLKGYGLSDNPDKPYKWVFPDMEIPAGGYLAVYLGDATTGFGLSSDGECVLLSDPKGRALHYIPFGPQQNDVSLVFEGGIWQETYTPTPGEKNVVTDKAAYEQSVYESNLSGLFISEVVASNGTFDLNGNAFDYVELYNGSKKRIRLTDFFLSDDVLNPQKWTFPKGATLAPGGYALIYMAGREIVSSKPNTYYAGFKLSKTNGLVLLSKGEEIVDHISLGRQYGNIAYGRVSGQGTFCFFEEQTPRAKNPASGFLKRTGDVRISEAGGLYKEPVSVRLSADEDAVIHYTLDGSTPTKESPVYTGPISIEKNTALRARAFQEGMLSSTVSSASYLFDVDVSVPVVALITDEKYLTDPGMGLFVKGSGSKPNYQQNWEYPMHVQYFDKGEVLVNQLASFTTTGGLGLTRPQKTISIFARGALGADRFYFNPFPNRDYDSYNALTLRSGGTESRGTRFKDELLTSLAQGLNVMYQDAVPVVVYINGKYWGHYNLREKINQDSIAQWEGITDEDVIEGITILRSRGAIVKGSRSEMMELIQFCKQKDLNDPEKSAIRTG